MLPAQPQAGLNPAEAPLRPSCVGEAFGIVAGGGVLPRLVADAAAKAGWTPVVVAVGDGLSADWSGYDATPLGWGRTGDIFPFLRRRGVAHMVFCGTISARPDYRSLLPSLKTLALLPEILRIVRGGDDSLLRAVSKAFERRGFALHGVHELLPELLTPQGVLTTRAPGEDDRAALARAMEAATGLGSLDIGQAAVASADRVIALEGIEGTREMMARVADLRVRGRIGSRERCVLFKSAKPQQDKRFDLPSIGVETVEQAHEAGLVGIGLTAGASLLLDAQAIVARADASGLFVVGIAASERP
ncbi:LpxI family protein [Aureimonas populi]|uniref:LpxI family protein n=1 Tax=Aureimonas populi TaxID=1701758 RepID=A0ABW5CSH2_9HYPH|nr:UDP-2,3-diacylglucosamine diphosphatase LpxI [Aureimonas populi]